MSTLGRLLAAVKDARGGSNPPVPMAPRQALISGTRGPAQDMAAALEATSAIGTLYSIVNRLATAVADTPWHLYVKRPPGADPDDERTEVHSHPALNLLQRPNRWTTTQELFEAGQQHQDLAGEAYLVVVRSGRVPVELWNVRPDRMAPKKSAKNFLDGWTYTIGRDQISLGVDDVLQNRTPNPTDPYRGLSPVAALLAPMHGLDAALRWNAGFFRNGAEPGGIIEVEKALGDDEFDQLAQRWRSQHGGVSNAHRVAILEGGTKWVPRASTQRDMEFIEGIRLTRELVMEAFGMSKTMLGLTEDVNRATAESALFMFAAYQVVGRLNRWRALLNNDLLPMFPGGERLEFDYESPVPEDGERETAALTARATAWAQLIAAGADPVWAATQAGLPEPVMAERPEPAAPGARPGHQEPDGDEAPGQDDTDDDAEEAPARPRPAAAWLTPIVAAAPPAGGPPPPDTADLDAHQADWEAALAALLTIWVGVRAAQATDLQAQARDAAAQGAVALAAIVCADHGGTDALADALIALWDRTAAAETAQSHALGHTSVTAPPAPADLAEWARATADLLRTDLEQTARRRAVQAAGGTPEDVAAAVRDAVDGVGDAGPRAELGGALTRAQGSARLAVMDQGPVVAYYSSAHLDAHTCAKCREADDKWLGNTLEDVAKTYPAGQFVHCLGGPRCRCQVVATYRGRPGETSYEKEGPVTVPGQEEQ